VRSETLTVKGLWPRALSKVIHLSRSFVIFVVARLLLRGNPCGRIPRRQTPKSPMPGHRGGKSRSRPKSGFPISRIRDSGQIGIPDFPNPGFRPNRDSRFPEIRDSGQIGIQIRENPDFFCSGQNRDCTLSAAGQAIAFPRRGPWVGKEAYRPMTRSRQRLHGPVEAHTT